MTNVKQDAGMWTDERGGTLAYRLWLPSDPAALVVIVHGYTEHTGRYRTFAEALAARGVAVAAPDLPGHGLSSGPRGHLGALPECVRTLATLVRDVVLPVCGLERYTVFGHSFGGLLAIVWGAHPPDELARLALNSPLVETAFRVPWWKHLAGEVAALAAPQMVLPIGLDPHALCSRPEVVRDYLSDPLVHGSMSAGTYRSMRDTQRRMWAWAGEFRVPVLLTCAGQDRIVSAEAARRWLARVPAQTRTEVFPDCYHELHHEPGASDRLADLVSAWCTS
ncbi:MAG TPA: alpha/beta hydrolase [bacterium]